MSELALILIKEAKAARKKSLDLGNCGLTDIPKEVFQLTWLEELNLCNAYEKLDTNKTIESKNQGTPNRLNIEKLPDEFTQLCELRTLRINGNFKNFKFGGYVINRFRINNFDILKKLEKLTNIDLSFNKISDYSFLQNLSNLQSLDLRSNQISDISFLQNLSNLTEL